MGTKKIENSYPEIHSVPSYVVIYYDAHPLPGVPVRILKLLLHVLFWLHVIPTTIMFTIFGERYVTL
jgi:hypothetical protein